MSKSILDDYGLFINSPALYESLARQLGDNKKTIFICWTDGKEAQLDIIFSYDVSGYLGNTVNIQRGLQIGYLFVSIISGRTFGFKIDKGITTPTYYEEKLGVYSGETINGLADLINGVRHALFELQKDAELA